MLKEILVLLEVKMEHILKQTLKIWSMQLIVQQLEILILCHGYK